MERVQNMCREQGIVPVNNLPNEDLRLTKLKRLDIMEKDLGEDPRYSSLTEVASYLTECPFSAINILGSTLQRCKIIFGLSKEEEQDFEKDEPRELRIGIHSGALIAGISGNTFDIWGDAVNIASCLESSSDPGKIQISDKTRDYLEGTGKLTHRGNIVLKGKGNWSTFFLETLS